MVILTIEGSLGGKINGRANEQMEETAGEWRTMEGQAEGKQGEKSRKGDHRVIQHKATQ